MASPYQGVIGASCSWISGISLLISLAIPLTCIWTLIDDTWAQIFWTIFSLRYIRLVGHTLGFWLYTPAKVKAGSVFSRNHVTVVLPTIDPEGPDFEECLTSILANRPAAILVVTVGSDLLAQCQRVLKTLSPRVSGTRLAVSALSEPSKRRQVTHAIKSIETPVTILADDHVFWASEDFIPSVLAPFENPRVGVVATKKRVRRTTLGEWSWPSLVNFIACNYLQRHNWELRASNGIDGGVFVVSGRTAVYRTEFLRDSTLLDRFCNEKFFFGLFGGARGLGPDDDNFLTREAFKRGWLIRFQDTEDGTIETTLGEWPKFRGQLLRWARTTFRSNPVMLRDMSFLFRYPWSAFMVYWAGMANFAILWDAALFATLAMSSYSQPTSFLLLLSWMFWSKTVKLIPHFFRHPSDLLLIVFQVAFAYIHSFIKLWALITFWDCDWSGRNLDDVERGIGLEAAEPFYIINENPEEGTVS